MITDIIKIKQADTHFNVIDLIRERWSARSFTGESLSETEVHTLLEAAIWAPSAMNEQPWRFVTARRDESEGFARLLSYLKPGNAAWAQNAGALILVLGRTNYTYKERPNINVSHDCGMATMNLLIQATSMEIFCHVMEGFSKEEVQHDYQLGEKFIPVTMIALGKQDSPENLEEPYRSRETSPRTRKPLGEVVFEALSKEIK